MINWVLYAALVWMCVRGLSGRHDWALVAAVFFVPLTQALPSPLGAIGAPANILILTLLVARLRVARPPVTTPMPLRILLFLMMALLLKGLLHRVYLEQVGGRVYLNTLEVTFLVAKEWSMFALAYALTYRIVSSRLDVVKMWVAALLCVGGEALLASYERLQGVGRATAHLAEPNRAGAYFAAAGLLALALALLRTDRLRLAAFGIFTLCLGALFASLSRGALLAAATGLLVVLLLFYRHVHEGTSRLAVTVIVILVAMNGALLLPERVRQRILFTFTEGSESGEASVGLDKVDRSSEERLMLWRAAYEIIQANPLGIGFNTFATEIEEHTGLHKVAHNVYIQVCTELGVPALAVLLLLVAAVWWRCWRSFHASSDWQLRTMSLGLMGCWSALCVAVLFINPFFAFNLCGQFWILLAARLKLGDLERVAQESDPGAPGRARVAAGRGMAGYTARPEN